MSLPMDWHICQLYDEIFSIERGGLYITEKNKDKKCGTRSYEIASLHFSQTTYGILRY